MEEKKSKKEEDWRIEEEKKDSNYRVLNRERKTAQYRIEHTPKGIRIWTIH